MRIVIAGAGSVGRYLIERLVEEDHDIVVIDLDEEVLAELSTVFDIQTIEGSASALETLGRAGVAEADIFIAATSSDETNLIACMLADSLNTAVRKIARVRKLVTDASGLSDRIAEIFDQFINPDSEAVAAFLRLFEVPGAVEMMEFGNGKIWVVGFAVRADATLVGKKLRQISASKGGHEILIVAIQRDDQIIIPHGEDIIQAGDEVYIASHANEVDFVYELLGREHRPVRSVMVYGGGGIGRRLADALSQRDVKVKLIEPNQERAVRLADELSDVLVLCGDATDQDLLKDEGIEDIDVFVGATSDEENNILAALLAKRMGARMGAVVVTKSSYLHLIPEIGVDLVVSPHIAAASSILKFVRKGSVSSIFSTRDDTAEVLEITASEGSSWVGKPLREVKLPSGVIVAAIRDDNSSVTIPKGGTSIKPGNHVIFFASRRALPKLQKMVASDS